jgi:hypothetical protein
METKRPLPVEGMQLPMMFYPVQQSTNRAGSLNFKHCQARVVSVFLILIGIACIIFNAISLWKNDIMPSGLDNLGFVGYGCIGHGIWSGVLFIITGIIGLAASCKKNKCVVMTFMVMCIISAVSTAAMISLGIIGAITANNTPQWFERYEGCGDLDYYYYYYYYYYGDIPSPPTCSVFKVVVAMESLLAIMALFAAIFAIWGSALCCKAAGCCSKSEIPNGVMMMPAYGEQQQGPFYVWPAQGNGGYPAMAPTLSPPVYTPQVQVPAYTDLQTEENKTGSSC